MSRGATMSIMGLYNNDDSIFDLMSFPEGFTDNDKQLVQDSILVECAELEILYPAPAVMKTCIGIWSRKEIPYWQRVYNASKLEYNPIENYRRNESEAVTDGRTEQHSGNDVNTHGGSDSLAGTGTVANAATGSDTSAGTGTVTNAATGSDRIAGTGTVANAASGSDTSSGASQSTTADGGSDRAEHKISGYDSNTLVANTEDDNYYGKSTSSGTQAQTTNTYGRTDTETRNTLDSTTYGRTDTETRNTLDTNTYGRTDTETRNTLDTTTYGHTETLAHGEKIQHSGTTERHVLAYGNIGVTTSQDMLTQEIEIAKINNVIPIIIESFKERFCLMVY